jgi:hypothetical protein
MTHLTADCPLVKRKIAGLSDRVEIWYQYLNLMIIVVLATGFTGVIAQQLKVTGGDARPTVLIIKKLTIIEEGPYETYNPGLDERHR